MKLKFVFYALVVFCITLFISCNRGVNQNTSTEQPQASIVSVKTTSAKIDTKIPLNVSNLILKHFEAIENGDLTSFRSTLKPQEDGADMYAQLSLIYKFFGDFFNVNESAFNRAVSDGGGDLDKIIHTAFSGEFPAKKRNTGLVVKEMEMENNYIKVIVSNNKKEESVFHLTYYDGGTYEGIPLVGIDRHLTLPKESSLVFPPQINLFMYDSSFSNRPGHGFPNTRIWGWSKNGKVAYSIERGIDGRGGQIIDFIILDLITDKTIFELKMDSFDHNETENEDLYEIYETVILNAKKEHDIIQERSQFLAFPFKKNNIEHNARLIDITYKDDEYGFFEKVVTGYKLSVTANTKSKIVSTFVPLRSVTSTVYVCGYFLSPFENRIMIVTSEESWVHEGTEMFYRFSGCHLGVGFN